MPIGSRSLVNRFLAMGVESAETDAIRKSSPRLRKEGLDTRLLRISRVVVLLVFGAAGLAVVTGAAQAVLDWGSRPQPVVEPAGSDEECVDPPCLPESWPPPESLPLVVPVLVLTVAVIIGVLVFVSRLVKVRTGSGGLLTSGLLLVAAPVLVLIGAEIVPHVVTPCWAGELGGVCVETEGHGIDYADHLHQLGHAILGWLPMTVGYWLVLRKWRPALLPGQHESEALR